MTDPLLKAAEDLLAFIRSRFPLDFAEGGKGFTCPYHQALDVAIRAKREPPDEGIATLIEDLEAWANNHGVDAPNGFNYWRYEPDDDHWHCSECGKKSRDGHSDVCFKLRLVEAAKALRAVRDGRREEPAVNLGADTPWPLSEVLTRLADAADHLLNYHDCDRHGWEGVTVARDAARRYAAQLAGPDGRRAPDWQPEETPE